MFKNYNLKDLESSLIRLPTRFNKNLDGLNKRNHVQILIGVILGIVIIL